MLRSHTLKVNKFTIITSMLGAICCLALAISSILSTYIPFAILAISTCTCAILMYKKLMKRLLWQCFYSFYIHFYAH